MYLSWVGLQAFFLEVSGCVLSFVLISVLPATFAYYFDPEGVYPAFLFILRNFSYRPSKSYTKAAKFLSRVAEMRRVFCNKEAIHVLSRSDLSLFSDLLNVESVLLLSLHDLRSFFLETIERSLIFIPTPELANTDIDIDCGDKFLASRYGCVSFFHDLRR